MAKISSNINKPSIDSISSTKLKELLMSLLEKEKYVNLKDSTNNLIVGESNQGLSKVTTLFYIYQKPLSGGNVDINDLIRSINFAHKSERPDLFILVTGFSISGSIERKLKQELGFNIEIFQREQLEALVNQHFPNFWMYENFDLVSYEKYFLEEMVEKSALLNIQGLENKAQKLVDIYIKPRLYEVKSDLESNSTQLNRVKEIDLVHRKNSCIIQGDTGSGKSTLLKEIGKLQIKEQKQLKVFPVFISPMLLINSEFNIEHATLKLLDGKVPGEWNEIIESYGILFLVDNIDEFNYNEQRTVIEQLNVLSEKKNIRYILTTRTLKTGKIHSLCKDSSVFQIRKFNDLQIKEFASRFFNDTGIANDLLEALEDHRILERLPMTPLSFSLIALVYEKENYEIPSTISDIYDNFNQLILGKLTATKKFELINFNLRERILSVYALQILQHNNGRPYRKSNFIDFFSDYFRAKSSNVDREILEGYLNFFMENSGILKLEEDDYVVFTHKSFMEYYASIEVFKHQRDLSDKLVENFLNLNWQNVAIFYAGQSKDMPKFSMDIYQVVRNASKLEEHNNAILGLGYLLQALYLTDNKIREEGVLLALEQSLVLHDWYKKIISDGDMLLFKKMRLPALSIFNMYFFYMNFLSSTLRTPMEMAFNYLLEKYKNDGATNTGFQLLTLAAVFHSNKIGDSSYLLKLLDETTILKNPYLVTVAEFALYFDRSSDHKEIKGQLHKAYLKLNNVTKSLIEIPADRLRFSNLDLIESNKKVTLICEGPTDVEILEHAYNVLSNNRIPYWKIKPAGSKGGGASEVKFALDKAKPLSEKDFIIIGIFDSDTEGTNQFNGLQFDQYKDYKRVKKMLDTNIFGIKLPVPDFRKDYLNQEPEHQYLTIEHYFEDEELKKHNLLKETGIPNIFKIKGATGVKNKFAKHVKSIDQPDYFKHFIPLFETIDDICQVDKMDYHKHL